MYGQVWWVCGDTISKRLLYLIHPIYVLTQQIKTNSWPYMHHITIYATRVWSCIGLIYSIHIMYIRGSTFGPPNTSKYPVKSTCNGGLTSWGGGVPTRWPICRCGGWGRLTRRSTSDRGISVVGVAIHLCLYIVSLGSDLSIPIKFHSMQHCCSRLIRQVSPRNKPYLPKSNVFCIGNSISYSSTLIPPCIIWCQTVSHVKIWNKKCSGLI